MEKAMEDVSEARSRNMRAVRGTNTRPEMLVRRGLHRRGLRFRLHRRDLPGCPDIVLPRHRAVVFVHGCFWHRHEGCRYATTPATRREFWQNKFTANFERDRRALEGLRAAGWRVAVVWECALKGDRLEPTIEATGAWILSVEATATFPATE